MDIKYFQLIPMDALPSISELKPFLAILVVDEQVGAEWRDKVSHWLVKSGCKYMLSWGKDRAAWNESVDLANIAQFQNGQIPEDELVLTSDQNELSLDHFFTEAKITATQDCSDFDHTLILHISMENKEKEVLTRFSGA